MTEPLPSPRVAYLASRSRRRREKSVLKFKAKVRERTVRKRNLDAEVIVKLNRVIRGTANYFAAGFSTCRWMSCRCRTSVMQPSAGSPYRSRRGRSASSCWIGWKTANRAW